MLYVCWHRLDLARWPNLAHWPSFAQWPSTLLARWPIVELASSINIAQWHLTKVHSRRIGKQIKLTKAGENYVVSTIRTTWAGCHNLCALQLVCCKTIDLFSTTSLESQESSLTTVIIPYNRNVALHMSLDHSTFFPSAQYFHMALAILAPSLGWLVGNKTNHGKNLAERFTRVS